MAVAMIASLSACGKKDEEQTSQTTTSATEEADKTTTDAEDTDNDPTSGDDESKGSDNTCVKLTDAILNSGIEFGATMQMEDETMLTDVNGYDLNLFDEYSVVQQMMSVHLIEIVVVKPAEGKMSDALEMLEKRKKTLKENAAFYEAQKQAADATVVGSKDGYAYLICDVSADKAEEALLKAMSE